MTVYARSDVVYVAIPVENGGCGSSHGRPVLEGAPAKLWRVDCPHCEKYLQSDPLWANSSLEIPLTPDEERVAKKLEEQGDMVMHQVSAALAKSSIENLRTAQADDLDAQAAKQERDELKFRYETAMAELERLSRIIEKRADVIVPPSRPDPYPEVTRTEEPQVLAPRYERKPEPPERFESVSTAYAPPPPPQAASKLLESGNRNRSKDHCPGCGGPMRRPGSRGPTPKGVCLDCRDRNGL